MGEGDSKLGTACGPVAGTPSPPGVPQTFPSDTLWDFEVDFWRGFLPPNPEDPYKPGALLNDFSTPHFPSLIPPHREHSLDL